MLTANSDINCGLLSALLPVTFIHDFKITSAGIICYFKEDIEQILPQVSSFLDALKEVTMKNFYFDMKTKEIGTLKTYDAEPLSFNEKYFFQEVLCDYIDHGSNKQN